MAEDREMRLHRRLLSLLGHARRYQMNGRANFRDISMYRDGLIRPEFALDSAANIRWLQKSHREHHKKLRRTLVRINKVMEELNNA